MLQLINNNLTTSESIIIDSHDTILTLQADKLGCTYFGLITLTNKVVKTIQFVNTNTYFKARLLLTKEELQFLDNATLKILSVSLEMTQESNELHLTFNKEKILLTIKQQTSDEIAELKRTIVSLQEKLDALSLGKPLTSLNIKNKDYIQPGMTLIARDNNTFIAAYPFVDIITNINGQVAVDGIVNIDASMIKYTTERTIEEQLKIIGEAIKVQNQTIKVLSTELNMLSKKLADLTVKVETHLDNGII